MLGFAGLASARRTGVGLALFGSEPAGAGRVIFDGWPAALRSPDRALRQASIDFTICEEEVVLADE